MNEFWQNWFDYSFSLKIDLQSLNHSLGCYENPQTPRSLFIFIFLQETHQLISILPPIFLVFIIHWFLHLFSNVQSLFVLLSQK